MNTYPIKLEQRKIKKSYRSVTGHIPSVKNKRSIAFESKLESQYFLTLEFNDDVKNYMEQPQIEIILDGKKTTYTADCFIQRTENTENRDALVEVKYTSELEKEKEYFDKKFQAVREVTDELNLDFIIFTERTYPETYIENLDFLYRYKRQGRETKYDNIIKEKLQNQKLSAYDLANHITSDKLEYIKVSNAIWGMVAVGILKTDLYTSKVNMKSIVELNNGSC